MPYHILMVDDDSYFRSEFRELMEDVDVMTASNGKEALKILKKPHNIDLVIMDQMMPGMKGTDLLKEIGKISSDIRTILLTGQGSKEVAVEGLRSHATEFIEKPLNAAKIRKIKELALSAPKGEKDKNAGGIKGKIEQAKFFAQRNYDKPFTLEDVANEVCLSPKYLSRLFKEQTGMRFSDYKLQIRMDKAKEVLINSGDNIEEISYQLGYQNPESFIKVFRKFNQCTPKEFRNKGVQNQKQSKVNLREENSKLRIENRRINKESQDKSDQLDDAEDALDEEKHFSGLGRLAAIVAHELRHPLGVIQTAAWNIRKKTRGKQLDDNLKSIEKMISESEQIINNLLEYSRIKEPDYITVRINDLVNEMVDTMKIRFDKKRARITKYFTEVDDTTIETDPLQLKEVLTNLFTNSYEALPKGKKGKITIKTWVDKKYLFIQVKDNGNGINPEDYEKIFQPFFSRKHKGTGLGLAISYEIIQMHHGVIDFDTKLGKGTTFTLKLPIKKQMAAT